MKPTFSGGHPIACFRVRPGTGTRGPEIDFQFQDFNDEGLRLSGISEEDLLGSWVSDLERRSPDSVLVAPDLWKRVASCDGMGSFEWTVNPCGSMFRVSVCSMESGYLTIFMSPVQLDGQPAGLPTATLDLLQTLIETIPDPVCITDQMDRFILNNRAHLDLLGVPAQPAATGKTVKDFFSPTEAEMYLTTSRTVRLSGTCLMNQTEQVTDPTTGQTRWFLVSKTSINLERGTGVVSVLREVTDLQTISAEKQVSEEHYQILFEQALNPILVVDETGRYIDANPAALQFLEESREDLLAKTIWDYIPPDQLEKQTTGQTPFPSRMTMETDYLVKGMVKTLLLNVVPSKDSGKPVYYGTGVDITERKRIEQVLRENEQFLGGVLMSIQDGISVLDLDLTINHVNQSMNEWNRTKLPLEGKRCFEVYHNRSQPCPSCPSLRCIQTGQTEREVVPALYGSPIEWVEVFSYPIKDPGTGKVTGIVEFVRDITATVKMEQALRESDARWQFALDGAGDGLWDWNYATGVAYYSRQWKEMLGYREEDIGTSFAEWERLVHPEDQERHRQETDLLLQGKRDLFIQEFRMRGKDGNWKWILSRGKVVERDSHGRPLRIIGTHTDLTERKKTEDRLSQSEQFLDSVIEYLPNMVFVKDAQHLRYVRLNRAGEEFLGYSRHALIGKSDRDLFPPDQAEFFITTDRQAIASQQLLDIPEETINTAKGLRILHTRKIPILDGEGNPSHLLGISEDITIQKAAQDRIRYLSFHDSLTGCYNRAFIEEELKRLGDSRLLPLGVMLCDVNGLKLTNDAFGHQAGDRLLQRFVRLLQESCRKEDLVGRWGGDEFILLLPQVQESTIRELAGRIREACRKAPPQPVPLSVSLGWSVKQSSAEAVEGLISRAEQSMYRDKLDESRTVRTVIIASLEQTLREITQEVGAHARRLGTLGKAVARAYHLREQDLDNLDLLARLHDLGMISVPRVIIQKKGPLTPEEWEVVRKHPEVGYRIVQSNPELASIAEEILSHHEHWDGSGYPRGLNGEEIPLLARIIAVVDAFDVMTEGRLYQRPVTVDQAIQELKQLAGSRFDPHVVEVFVGLMKE